MKLVGRKNGTFQPEGSKESYPWVNLCFLGTAKNVEGSWPSILKVSAEFQKDAMMLEIGGEYDPMFDQYGKVICVRDL